MTFFTPVLADDMLRIKLGQGHVGDMLDVQHPDGQWYQASINQVTDTGYMIHYAGMDEKEDRLVLFASNELDALCTKTINIGKVPGQITYFVDDESLSYQPFQISRISNTSVQFTYSKDDEYMTMSKEDFQDCCIDHPVGVECLSHALIHWHNQFKYDKRTCDVMLEVKCDDQTLQIPAHRQILAAQSEYFFAVFYGPNKSLSHLTNALDNDSLPRFEMDISKVCEMITFRSALHYIYAGIAPRFSWLTCYEVWFIADYLQMKALQTAWSENAIQMCAKLTWGHEIWQFMMDRSFSANIIQACENGIAKNLLCFNDRISTFPFQLVKQLVGSEYIPLTESDWFLSLRAWQSYHPDVDQKEYHNALVQGIRWHLLSDTFIAEEVEPYHILSIEHIRDLFLASMSTKRKKELCDKYPSWRLKARSGLNGNARSSRVLLSRRVICDTISSTQ